jgi:hypothetical protein
MSPQLKLIPLPLVGTILLCVLIGIYLFASKRFSRAKPVIIKHPVDTDSDDALKYWTEDKMRKAKPADMPHVDVPDKGKRRPRRPRV